MTTPTGRRGALWSVRVATTLAVSVLCLAAGVFAVWGGLSKAWLRTGQVSEALIFGPHLADAQLELASVAQANGQSVRAARLARAAIAVQPYGLGAMRLLAQSYPGDSAQRRAIVTQIGRLSLRDTYSQAWLMDDDFMRSDVVGGAFHADALLRRGAASPPAVYFSLISVMNTDAGRAAIAERLRSMPPWRVGFFRAMASSARPADSISLLQRLGRLGDVPQGGEIGPLVLRLLNDGRYSDLEWYCEQFLWHASDTRQIVYDGKFDALAGPAPLNWEAQRIAGGAAIWRPNETQNLGVLDLTHDLFSSSGPLIRQLVFLGPGGFKVSADFKPIGEVGSGRFHMDIDCVDGRQVASVVLRGPDKTWSAAAQSFASLGDDCPVYWLSFRPVTGDFAQAAEILVDNVKIGPAVSAQSAPRVY